jgi:hypothetical protein
MNCFQLIRTVLDEAYSEIPGSEAEKDHSIEKALTGLSKAYTNLLAKGCLDYSDPCRRFAYIYRYTTSHANIVYEKIRYSNRLASLFDRDKLLISCIGGGPGSDFLGIMKYCMLNKKTIDLKCRILDRDPSWSESWSDVDDKIEAPFRISTSHQPLDVADPASWQKYCKHFNADLFTLIYFISEIYAVRDKANDYFKELFARMNPRAMVLYVDNNDSRFTEWFDELVTSTGFEVVNSGSGYMWMPSEEETSDLGIYVKKFSSPKLKPDVAFRIVRKPNA